MVLVTKPKPEPLSVRILHLSVYVFLTSITVALFTMNVWAGVTFSGLMLGILSLRVESMLMSNLAAYAGVLALFVGGQILVIDQLGSNAGLALLAFLVLMVIINVFQHEES